MQIIDRIREKMKANGVSVLILSKETGISPYKIYKWLDSKGKPKYEDTQLLEKWVSGKQELVPRETQKETPALAGVDERFRDKDELIASLKKQIEYLERERQDFDALKEKIAVVESILHSRSPVLERIEKALDSLVKKAYVREYPSKGRVKS